VFADTTQHVPRASVLKATEAARRVDADGIVTFGGGTPNDTGKGVALALAEGITTSDGFDAFTIKFEYPDKIEIPAMTSPALPMVAIPTTLSAGEFTHFVGITDEERKIKDLAIDKNLAAKAIFLDAELTVATPMWLWLSSGIRSVDHAVEGLSSTTAHPFTDGLGVHALKLFGRYLRESKADPSDLVARTYCQVASWLSISGLANVTLGLSHGIGHQLGARNDVPHGHTSCVMMHATMVHNKDHVGDRQRLIAEALGVDTRGFDDAAAREAGRDAVLQLIKDLDLPHRLRDVGVGPDDFQAIANDALGDLIVATNPRPISGVDEIVELLHTAH
jgi:alcohol dehydrogenase class IV